VSGPLSGITLVVTRAIDQAAILVAALVEQGAVVVEMPVIAIVDPVDGGAALEEAVRDLGSYDWVVVTSSNGACRIVEAISSQGLTFGDGDHPRFAAIGPMTAEPLLEAGLPVDLVPNKAVAEALLDEFPVPGPGGRVLLARAEIARSVLPDGLRSIGWKVDVVTAYRTMAPEVDPGLLDRARRADAVTFTSESIVRRYADLAGGPEPVDAVCIGPISAAVARDLGFRVVEADPHSVAGLIDAVYNLARS
jgi:uroporphyrinogen-III synthase|tara:strand:+ start:21640 stop:22389 length:750 start_codon:yes stop_codon:yes gene_type:complete